MKADVLVSPQGSIVLFDLLTAAANAWVEDRLDPEAHWFSSALVVEHRYAADLVRGLLEDGLCVAEVR